MDFLSILRSCITGMVPVTLVTFSGAYLAKKDIFNKEANELISKSCARFFFVVQSFATIPKSVKLSSLVELWPIPVITFLIIIIGLILSFLSLYFLKPPTHFKFTTLSILVFTNGGNIPFLIMKGICASYGPLAGDDKCDEYPGYIALVIFVCSILIWSICIAFIKADEQETRKIEELASLTENKSAESSLKDLMIRGMFSPVPISCILSLILALIPGFDWLFVHKTSPLYSIFDSLFVVAYVGVVVSQMIIGSNLYMMEKADYGISKFYIISTTLMKNVIYPCFWLLLTLLLWNLGCYGNNKVMAYIIYIAQATPVASTVLMQCQLVSSGVKDCTVILLWQYITAPITLTVFTYLFFIII
ncbi:unnamed protein product [Blepharisma stoltei]|uniref:Auxin efflux carrier family protein n=1 Tax=Blepharisma stoltei TaxID=1481888 RepID=A0AAU9KCX0_9CILI|nr:unnamed protein product [Blepharisma stoltei]